MENYSVAVEGRALLLMYKHLVHSLSWAFCQATACHSDHDSILPLPLLSLIIL